MNAVQIEKTPCFQQLAIEANELTFQYGLKKQNSVLKDININITNGIIYGLLGPSGCGKTTLLKCIVGMLKPNHGTITIYGKSPGDPDLNIPGRGIGYMPQDLALYLDITVKETLIYFGSLYFMTKRQLKQRIRFLLDFLEIPYENSLIKNLSGGQKRRVSFACALIHQPPLLILDEPTVGVDPLLRHSIWEHLNNLTVEFQTTVLITTHYVEEARKANTVGLMKNGRLLAETNPEILIQQYQVNTLEDVFWKLCLKYKNDDEENEKNNHIIHFKPQETKFESSTAPNHSTKKYEEIRLMKRGVILTSTKEEMEYVESAKLNHKNPNERFSYRKSPSSIGIKESFIRMSALIHKSFMCFRRNKLLSISQILLPAFEIIVFCLCIGHEPFDLSFAIFNNETDMFGFSQTFLDSLSNRTFKKVYYENLPSALDSVKKGETWGAIYIGPSFSSALTDRFLEGSNVENETIFKGTIKLYLDFTNQQITLTIYGRIMKTFQEFAKHMLEKLYQNPYLAESPISIEAPIYGTAETNFYEFVIPGLVLGLTHVFAIALTLLPIVIEKKEGLIDRCWVAGVSAGEMITAIMCILFFSMLVQIGLVLISTIFFFNLTIVGSVFWVFVCILLAGISGMAYGLLVSSMCNNEVEALFVAVGSFYPILLFSGMLWPVEGMPYYFRYISYCLPLTFLSKTMRSIMYRGWHITENYTWIGCVVPLGWTIIFLILASVVVKLYMVKRK